MYRLEKNLKIADELIGYCYKKTGKHLNVDFAFLESETIIKIRVYIENLGKDCLEHLNETLCTSRQHEIEECFWMANGDDSFGEELTLVGAMVDKATINYEDNVLMIELRRIDGKVKP